MQPRVFTRAQMIAFDMLSLNVGDLWYIKGWVTAVVLFLSGYNDIGDLWYIKGMVTVSSSSHFCRMEWG